MGECEGSRDSICTGSPGLRRYTHLLSILDLGYPPGPDEQGILVLHFDG